MADKTKIEWADATWNPVTGCRHGCEYCYAQRIAERFGGFDSITKINEAALISDKALEAPELVETWDNLLFENWSKKDADGRPAKDAKLIRAPYPYGFTPTLHRYRLDIPARWKKTRTIFVCSMADLFGEWVPTRWIVDVLDACAAAPQHRYLFLTKNPARYSELDYLGLLPHGANFWYGTSTPRGLAARPTLSSGNGDLVKCFSSIEPIHGPVKIAGRAARTDWAIIGAETGNRAGKVVPRREWIDSIVEQCDARGVPVFMKDSLIPIVGAENMRREFPWDETKGETT